MKRGFSLGDSQKSAVINKYLYSTNEGSFVNMRNCGLKAKEIVEAIHLIDQYLTQQQKEKIKSFTLTGITLNAQDFIRIVTALPDSLTTLDIVSNDITDIDEVTIFIANAFPNLTALYLSNNNIGPRGAINLAKALSSKLITLNLANNHIGAAGADAIIKMLPTSVTTLYLANNNIKTDGAIFISRRMLANNNMTLSHLDLSKNKIEDEGVEAILQWVSGSTLTNLELADNNFQTRGLEAIAKMLMTENSLTNLNLSGNKIDDKGGRIIAEALLRKNLVHVNLSGNLIGDIGALSFAKQPLLSNITLLLDLRKNSFQMGYGSKYFAQRLPGAQKDAQEVTETRVCVYLINNFKELYRKTALCELKHSAVKKTHFKP